MLLELQEGIDLSDRPFARIAAAHNVTEEVVVAELNAAIADGRVRRFGGVFDSRRLGYFSTLCAVNIPVEKLEDYTACMNDHPGITHCYERNAEPNLWFTLTSHVDHFRQDMKDLEDKLQPYPVLSLPVLRKFKINTVFNVDGKVSQSNAGIIHQQPVDKARKLTEQQKEMVRQLQGNVPVSVRFFDGVAERVGCPLETLLETLTTWKNEGVLRRIGAALFHRKVGFKANAMCVWKVEPEQSEKHGLGLASCPEVTHCYLRPSYPTVPFNLYAMIHADTPESAKEIMKRVSANAELPEARMLISSREFKKTSPVFFMESVAVA